jgi:hypothetical protein
MLLARRSRRKRSHRRTSAHHHLKGPPVPTSDGTAVKAVRIVRSRSLDDRRLRTYLGARVAGGVGQSDGGVGDGVIRYPTSHGTSKASRSITHT